MFAEERHRLMRDRVVRQGLAIVAELAQQLDITRETVRRDLPQLEQKGILRSGTGFIDIDEGFGLSTSEPMMTAGKTAIVSCARRVVVPADSSKLGEQTLIRCADLHQMDTLVTDAATGPDLGAAPVRVTLEVVLA